MPASENMKPANLQEISDAWWELLFSGPLFQVTMSDIPTQRYMTFRETCLRTALRMGRRASVRFRENLKYAYVQGADASAYMPHERLPISAAIEMMPPIARPPKSSRATRFDVGAVIERLMAEQTGPPVPAAVLLDHPDMAQYVRECDCAAGNFRSHHPVCPSYSWLPIMEVTLRKLLESPEDWYLRRQGIRPDSPPPSSPKSIQAPPDPWAGAAAQEVAETPVTGSGSREDPWAFTPKPPTVAWDPKSPVTFRDPHSDENSNG